MLYSWKPDRRATRAHIRHFIALAVQQKQWADRVGPEWIKGASNMSRDMLKTRRESTVYQLARNALEYARLRAFMPGVYEGWPGDKPAHDLWHGLANGQPVRFYDHNARAYVTRIGGAA